MSIFKNILFLQGYLTDPRDANDSDEVSYARGYGNHIASEKAFGRLGHAHANERGAAAPDTLANDVCATEGCG